MTTGTMDRSPEQEEELKLARVQALGFALKDDDDDGSSRNDSRKDIQKSFQNFHYGSMIRAPTSPSKTKISFVSSSSLNRRQADPELLASREFAVALALALEDPISGELDLTSVTANDPDKKKTYKVQEVTATDAKPPEKNGGGDLEAQPRSLSWSQNHAFFCQNSCTKRENPNLDSSMRVKANILPLPKTSTRVQQSLSLPESPPNTTVTQVNDEPNFTDTGTVDDPDRPKGIHRFLILLVVFLVVVAIAHVGLVGSKDDVVIPFEPPTSNPTSLSVSKQSPDSIIAVVPEMLERDGGACDLVARAFLNQVPMADVAIQNSGSCSTDIERGEFTVADAYMLLPKTHSLVVLEVTGAQIQKVLEDAVYFASVGGKSQQGGRNHGSRSYPYSAGLRYTVNATAGDALQQVSNIQVNERLDQAFWRPIDLDGVYIVLTNSFLAAGGEGGSYKELKFVPKEFVTDTGKGATETFVEYCLEQKTLAGPSEDEYSTQAFIPPF